MKKAATLAALVMAVPLLMGVKGCSPASTGSAGGPQVKQAPAREPGKCVVDLAVTHIGREVIGGMGFTCRGSALLTVKMWLLYDKYGDGAFDLAVPGRLVNSVTDVSPVFLKSPCQTGWWKVRIRGTETGVGAELEARGVSKVVHVVC